MTPLENVVVYRSTTEIIITGQPSEEELGHNCDAMGCGQEHVLYRFSLSEPLEETNQTCKHCGAVSKPDVRWCPRCKYRLH